MELRNVSFLSLSLGFGAVLLMRRRGRKQPLVLTVNRPMGSIAALDIASDLTLEPAPGNRGTEIHMRKKRSRQQLRELKSLLETGEVLQPSDMQTSQPTLLNLPLRTASKFGRKAGRL